MALLITPPGLLSFPNLFVAKPPAKDAKPRFNCILIFNAKAQKAPEFAALKAAELEAARKKHGDKLDNPAFMKKFTWAFHDWEEMQQYSGFDEGTVHLKPWSYQRPGVVWPYAGADGRPAPITVPDDIFPGQLARADVNFFGYTEGGNYGVSCGLNNLQIVKRDMPRLDNRVAASKAFDAIEDESDAAPFGNDDDIPF